MQTSLGRKLRILRGERGLSMRSAADLCGVTKETLSALERGTREPHDPTLAKIAKGYGVPFEELLEEPVPLGEASPKNDGVSEGERREEEHECREILLGAAALLEEIVETYKAAGDISKLTTLKHILMFNNIGAEQFVREVLGPLSDTANSHHVRAAGARLADLVDDLVEDLKKGRVGVTPVGERDDLLERRIRKLAG